MQLNLEKEGKNSSNVENKGERTLSALSLAALTSYSPSVLALNDMLRQQLQLTTQFVDSHKRLHQAYVRNLEPNYMYTTLEDTKNVRTRNLSFVPHSLLLPFQSICFVETMPHGQSQVIEHGRLSTTTPIGQTHVSP